ncbi:DNA-binding transcriptional ArsR family regulator [Catenuloplanes nepalensis]|uniref:DNA-binding transcriptional ArsR family regulator n=1 Tax=Catenuloplanes nepalensis TaxID=587533 RepID=A0ABT9MS61_9ACTN|nr:helix-turn-helix domain-containing protein [Catenuloplanes nepalensis]MDP9794131.1 DNA-binding transcriptional ArsR family regulator [Catenuloplanes nepalensis]
MALQVNATRLTYQERRQIAEGLAAGRGYAAIAAALGRPRSTVSREVARNGGIRGYQAARAEQATRWRARRRRTPPATPPSPDERLPADRAEFVDGFAAMMVQSGMPHMMALVLVCLFTSDTGAATTAELVARLRVSPASISKAVRWLDERGLARRERDGRRQRYVIDEHAWYYAWQASIASMTRWAAFATRGAELFGADTPPGARLHTTSRFFHHLGEDMTRAAEHWRQIVGDPP